MNEYGALAVWHWQRALKLGKKPWPVPLWLPQIPQAKVWDLSFHSDTPVTIHVSRQVPRLSCAPLYVQIPQPHFLHPFMCPNFSYIHLYYLLYINTTIQRKTGFVRPSRTSFKHHTLITNLMHWLLFIRKILLSSTCFEHQVIIFRRT